MFRKTSQNTYLTYYQRNKELISAKNKEYHHKNKDRLSTQARDKYRNLSEEKKKERLEYEKNRRQNMTEEDKIKRRAYIRSWYGNLPEDVKNKKSEFSKNRGTIRLLSLLNAHKLCIMERLAYLFCLFWKKNPPNF